MPAPPVVRTRLGRLHRGDALAWMASLPPGRARLIVADPPYNLGKAGWDRLGSPAEYLLWTRRWVEEARRLLLPDGTIYVCGFPEPIAAIASEVGPLFASWRCLVWHYRNKATLAADWGRSHESVLHLRKGRTMTFNLNAVREPYNRHTTRYPDRTQAATSHYGSGGHAWRPHPAGARPRDVIETPALCNGSAEKTTHPTQKPVELIRRLVLASSDRNDLVIDPFGGSGTTYAVCEEEERRWLGCERDPRYIRLIARRLASPGSFRARSAGESPRQRMQRRAILRGEAGARRPPA
ncbi:MAG TPA: site-specific DNA-methyltransferase [Candidatus Polarisedimenticolia bacterium]|nr:site-specific DNA-methyltransferase [Candidatus Polarisedimenticolia bacterium]